MGVGGWGVSECVLAEFFVVFSAAGEVAFSALPGLPSPLSGLFSGGHPLSVVAFFFLVVSCTGVIGPKKTATSDVSDLFTEEAVGIFSQTNPNEKSHGKNVTEKKNLKPKSVYSVNLGHLELKTYLSTKFNSYP